MKNFMIPRLAVKIRHAVSRLKASVSLSLLLVFAGYVPSPASPPLSSGRTEVSCAIHLHSDYSRAGNDTLEELVIKARAAGIKALIPSDRAAGRIEWSPFHRAALIRVYRDFPSIMAAGPEKYLTELALLEKKYPDMIIIPGAEAAADYSWEGAPWKGNLTIRNWHRHILIAGLEDPDDYRNMPAAGNRSGGKFDILMLWPVFLAAAGYASLKRSPRMGLFLFVAGAVFLAGNYPFRSARRSASAGFYSGSRNDPSSYQELIDYARSRGALVFWAHPEASYSKEIQSSPFKLSAATEPYEELLGSTKDYTGFAVFAEGYRSAGAPGGAWDAALLEYCDGKRNAPVWAAAELDYGGDSFGASIDILRNVIWMPSGVRPSKKTVMDALEKGNFYALWKAGGGGIYLRDFYVEGAGGSRGVFGGVVESSGELLAHLDVATEGGRRQPVKITIISDGRAVQFIETAAPALIRHRFSPPARSDKTPGRRKGYVRFVVEGDYPDKIAVNPVFYERGAED